MAAIHHQCPVVRVWESTATATLRLGVLFLGCASALRARAKRNGCGSWTARTVSGDVHLGANRDANGQVWARHGSVHFMSVLDGYSVIRIPEARFAAGRTH